MSTISKQEYITRIRQLEGLNATLAAQVDRMRPVVEAAITYRHERPFAFMTPFDKAVDAYEAQMAQLAKGAQDDAQSL